MTPGAFFALFSKHFGSRTRRTWMGHGRAHIELRQGDSHELHQIGEWLSQQVQRRPELYWTEVHQGTGRAVIAFEPGALDEVALMALVVEAEIRAGLAQAVFGRAAHPADQESSEVLFLELVADALGLVIGAGLKMSILPASRLAGALASGLAVVRSVPSLRRPLEDRWGRERTRLGLDMTIALLMGPAQRPLNSVVSIVRKLSLASEVEAQRRLWEEREASLCSGPGAPLPRSIPQRPLELPRGPIEDYSDRAWAVALGGFGVSFLSTRSVQRAFGALFGGLPQPAQLGRETFAAGLSRMLASRQMLVLDKKALRRLDRIDCLVLQGDIALPRVASVERIVFCPGVDGEREESAIRRLFRAHQPLAISEMEGYRLAPLGRIELALPAHMRDEARRLSESGELVLSLDRNGQLLALLEVRVASQIGLEELVSAAHDCSIRVVVASDDPEVLQRIPADDTIPAGENLRRGVRELQRDGRVVCVVARGDSPALDVADLAVALVPAGAQVPWTAHILCRDDLTDVRLLIESTRAAREVSRQSVKIALGAATLGALTSVGGLLPMTTSRVLTIVNLASLTSMANGVRVTADFRRKPLPPARDPTPWHALDPQGALRRLGSRPEGLSRTDALSRARRDELKKTPALELLAAVSDELFNPLVPLLAAGAGISAVAGSMTDSIMVGAVVLLNATIGGSQRYATERAIGQLMRETRSTVLVKREGKTEQIAAQKLVKGDLLLLSRGDYVPADCRIIESVGLQADVSGLTGESLPVAKDSQPSFEDAVADRSSMLYAGSTITSGQATALVVALGAETEAQRGAATFRSLAHHGGVEHRMRQLMELTAPVALAAGVGVVGAGLLRGRKMQEVVGSAVSLAVASVPEGLPLLATAAQLAGARRLREQGALVRNARALEALGRVDTLCVDKTGTLTQGTVVLAKITDGFGQCSSMERGALSDAQLYVLSSAMRGSPPKPGDLRRVDPVDAAIFSNAEAENISVESHVAAWKRIAEVPLEAGGSYSLVQGHTEQGSMISAKGAPETLLPHCSHYKSEQGEILPLSSSTRAQFENTVTNLALSGLRVLCVVERSLAAQEELGEQSMHDACFLGFLAFKDPVRKTAQEALAQLKRAGLHPVMVTGDHPSTAQAIYSELGLSEHPKILTGSDLARLDDEQLLEEIVQVDIFARVSPSQKVRIVRTLSKAGRTVAMVGDGANDAPAIRLASVGVAMGEHCAEAARNAADIVLTDARIETLGRAIVEGRGIWDAVGDAVSILVGGNLGEIGFTLLGGLLSGRPPLTARQLLLVNLFTDVAPATALALRAPDPDRAQTLAAMGPDAALGFRLNRDIVSRAIVTASGAGLAWTVSSILGDRRGASTTALLALVGSQLGQTLSTGQRSRQVVVTNLLSVLGLFFIVQTPGLSGAFGCRPLGPLGWAIVVGSSSAATVASRFVPAELEAFLKRSGAGQEGLARISQFPQVLTNPLPEAL
jgi:cation-transporting P-type ATPase I